jgi:ribose transport system substrate-binding protein
VKTAIPALAAAGLATALIVSGCTSTPSDPAPEGPGAIEGVSYVDDAGVLRFNSPVDLGDTATVGPDGEIPSWYTDLQLTAEEADDIRGRELRAALVWHTTSPFMDAVSSGAKATFEALGIDVVAETNANFDSNTLANDLQTVLALQPDIIVSIAIDPVADVAAFQPVVDQGVQLAFGSVKPDGYTAGDQYTSLVTYDLAGLGTETADALADDLGDSGKIGYIYYDANFYVTNQREAAFEQRLADAHPGIEVVDRVAMADPARAEEVASALLAQHPEIQAIFAPWDTAAEGVAAAVRNAGRTDVGIYTIDLGNTNALDMAAGGLIKEMTSTLAVEFGTSLALSGVYGVLGKEAPAMVIVPAFPVNKDNLAEGWASTFGQELPADIAAAQG